MFHMLQVLAVILVAVAMALALAHALELPGKLRVPKDTYLAIQPIYYPGFTIGGISEPLGLFVLLLLMAGLLAGLQFYAAEADELAKQQPAELTPQDKFFIRAYFGSWIALLDLRQNLGHVRHGDQNSQPGVSTPGRCSSSYSRRM